jgi:hypothetical protein
MIIDGARGIAVVDITTSSRSRKSTVTKESCMIE